jgi:Binding-protein-dependent transport system inner membrane component/Bacterial extracellular solute-binding proteins, family 5 Middle
LTRALLVALALVVIPASGVQAQRPTQVVLAIWGLPTRLVGGLEAVGSYVLMQIHDVLARTDEKGTPVPRLAEKWVRSADGKTYTVTLRPAKFQDGKPVTAEDVKFSYEFYLHPQFPVTSPGLLQIEGAQDVKDGKARAVAGYFGGWPDATLMRMTDMVLAFPVFFVAVMFLALFGPSIAGLVTVIGAISWPPTARLVRAEFLRLRTLDFVAAARSLGAPEARIMARHILPNIVAVIVISVTLRVGVSILAEASLSYLGLGVQPPTASWGNLVADGREYLRLAWWVSLFPGSLVFVSVMAFNLLGDGLRDAFDPRMPI